MRVLWFVLLYHPFISTFVIVPTIHNNFFGLRKSALSTSTFFRIRHLPLFQANEKNVELPRSRFRSIERLSELIEILNRSETAQSSGWEAALTLNHLGRLLRNPDSYKVGFEAACNTVVLYQDIFSQKIDDVDAKNLAWVLNAVKYIIPKLGNSQKVVKSTRSLLRAVEGRILSLNEIDIKNLSIILNSLSALLQHPKLNINRKPVFLSHLENLVCSCPNVDEQSTHAISTILNSFVRFRFLQSAAFSYLSTFLANMSLSSSSIRSLGLIAHAYGQLQSLKNPSASENATELSVPYEHVLNRVAERLIEFAPTIFTPRDIATVSSAFCKTSIDMRSLFFHLSSAAKATNLDLWDLEDLAISINAFSAAGPAHADLLRRLARAPLQRRTYRETLRPRHLAMILSGLARAEVHQSDLFEDYARPILEQVYPDYLDPGRRRGRDADLSSVQLAIQTRGDKGRAWLPGELAAVAGAYGRLAAANAGPVSNREAAAARLRAFRVAEVVLPHLADTALTLSPEEWAVADPTGRAAATLINALAMINFRHDLALDRLSAALQIVARFSFRPTRRLQYAFAGRPEGEVMIMLTVGVHGLAALNFPHPHLMQAFSRLLGAEPVGGGVQLSGTSVAQLAWALAVLDPDMQLGPAHRRVLAALPQAFPSLERGRDRALSALREGYVSGARVMILMELRQVYQYLLGCRIALARASGGGNGSNSSKEAAGGGVWWVAGADEPELGLDARQWAIARAAFVSRSHNRGGLSRLQAQVAETLRGMGVMLTTEWVDAASGYSLDLRLDPPAPLLPSPAATGPPPPGEEEWVAVEVDGPGHFAGPDRRVPLGRTLLKRQQLAGLGRRVVSIPYWEWPGDTESEARREYLARRLVQVGWPADLAPAAVRVEAADDGRMGW